MIKLFIDVRLNNYMRSAKHFTEKFVSELVNMTNVKTSIVFDENDVVSLMLLDQADNMLEFMRMHRFEPDVELIYNLSPNYPGWLLLVDTCGVTGSINPIVSKFFRWNRIESQSLLTLDEFLEMQ